MITVLRHIALLVADELNDVTWLAPLFDRLMKFHASWTANNLSATGLLVWGNDVAIGNDLKLEGQAEIQMDTGVAAAWT